MLFDKQTSRKPNNYPWTQDLIDAMWQGHWTPNEFDFKSDLHQYKTELDQPQQEIVVKTLSAIGQIEVDVKSFWANLGSNLPQPAMYDLGYVMANVEVIHNQAYEKLLSVLGLEDVFEDNLKVDVVKNRIQYLKKYSERQYNDDKKQYIYSLILFTLFVEYVSLFSQFYIIMYFNRNYNVLKDSAQQIQYTRNEELIHSLAGIKIINELRKEYPEYFDDELETRIYEEVHAAHKAEVNLIEWILGEYEDIGLTVRDIDLYIQNRFNDALTQIGFHQAFAFTDENKKQLENTLWADEEVYGNTMTDFFHKKPVEYSKGSSVVYDEELF